MPDPRLLNDRGAAGSTWLHQEPDGTGWVEHRQNVERSALRRMAQFAEHIPGREGSVARWVAHIPNIFIVKWRQEGLDIFSQDPEHQRRFKAKLNDPEFRDLRIEEGRV